MNFSITLLGEIVYIHFLILNFLKSSKYAGINAWYTVSAVLLAKKALKSNPIS
jgi:hypothetical protein